MVSLNFLVAAKLQSRTAPPQLSIVRCTLLQIDCLLSCGTIGARIILFGAKLVEFGKFTVAAHFRLAVLVAAVFRLEDSTTIFDRGHYMFATAQFPIIVRHY
jgi:hypothetical protein